MSAGDLSLQPPSDGISAVAFSPDSGRLLVASWDGTIQLHNLGGTPQPPTILSHPAAVLSICFGSSPLVGFSGGLDKRVRHWDFQTGQCRVLGKHDDAISSMVWCNEFSALSQRPASGDQGKADDVDVLVTTSWDATLKVWDINAPEGQNLRSSHALPAKAYTLSYAPATQTLLVSMAHRNMMLFKLPELSASTTQAKAGDGNEGKDTIGERREGALKFMTRSVACMADGKGWASGSIEGRIAVEYVDPSPESQASKYAFRAHRQPIDGVDHAYPINAIAYHPIHNTFATGGSDGHISIWDHTAKKRMKAYPKYPTSVSALAFSPDGKKLAIGCSYEHDNAITGQEDKNRVLVLIKETVMDDCKPKVKA